MNVYLFAAVILLLPALCTALGAAGVFLVRRADEPRTRRMLCGMAAGIMLAASVWSLLLPAIERAEAGILPVWLAPAAGLVLGAVGLLRLEEAFLQPAADDPADEQQGQRTDAPGCKGQPAFQQQSGDGKAEIVDGEKHRNRYLPDE